MENEDKWFAKTACADIPIQCEAPVIPALSMWGLVVLGLTLLVGLMIVFGRRQSARL